MVHYLIQSPKFNFLTFETTKNGIILTGETMEGLDKEDEIQCPYSTSQFMPIKKIIERRDSRSYPTGNGYWYKVLCETPPKI